MNRTKAPKTHKTGAISFISPEKIALNKTTPLYWMSDVSNETARIDVYFDAGLRKAKNSIASMTSSMLLSGTSQKNSTEIHNQLDDLGAFFDIGLSHEGVMVSLFALKRNISEAYHVLLDAIINASFPESEFQEVKAEKIQNFKININRVAVIAQRAFQKQLYYGTEYAMLSDESDLQKVERQELLDFHKTNYVNGIFKIAIVGALEEKKIQQICDVSKTHCIEQALEFKSDFRNKSGVIHVEKIDALQTAIRIGKTLFNKKHEDFLDVSILNTILGDYFGSRLMKNIREDKGYTYGIGSIISESGGSGYLLIGSEVGKEHLQPTLDEIKKEMLLLCNEKIGNDELGLVKNHLLGQMLKISDGPYAMMDLFLSVESYGLRSDFYNSYIQRIHDIDAKTILRMANSYLNWSDMSVISAG
tara:strand:+ start:10065 stop:11318 length:1254 start_codon:yes stop_codon:yes gene_type:complete